MKRNCTIGKYRHRICIEMQRDKWKIIKIISDKRSLKLQSPQLNNVRGTFEAQTFERIRIVKSIICKNVNCFVDALLRVRENKKESAQFSEQYNYSNKQSLRYCLPIEEAFRLFFFCFSVVVVEKKKKIYWCVAAHMVNAWRYPTNFTFKNSLTFVLRSLSKYAFPC